MRKIAVSLAKGGVGKTTTSVNLSTALAARKKRVLLVDTDTQGQCASVLGVSPDQDLAAVAAGEASLQDALTEARPNLFLLSGGRSLAGLKRLIDRKDFGGEQTLAELLSEAVLQEAGNFDFLIFDTSPGWDALTVNVLFCAEEVLAPVSLEALTLQSLLEFSTSLKAITKYKPNLELRFVVPTFLDRRVSKSDEILELLKSHYPALICDPIRYNVRLSEAPGHGQTIFEYAPNSTGAHDYARLAEIVLKRAPKAKSKI